MKLSPRSCLPFVALALTFAATTAAQAQVVIRSPTAIRQNTGGQYGPEYGIGNTIDRSGLFTPFVSGVTEFDSYIATNPLHTYFSTDYEWFTRPGVLSSTVVYDLGSVYSVDRLALWNEEDAGISSLILEGSQTVNFATRVNLGTFAITQNPEGENYGPQVLRFASTNTRYIRARMTTDSQQYLGMGEIAFGTQAAGNRIPEPGSGLLVGAVAIGVMARKRRARRA